MVPRLIHNQLFFPTLGPTVPKVPLTLLHILSDLYFVIGYKLKEQAIQWTPLRPCHASYNV